MSNKLKSIQIVDRSSAANSGDEDLIHVLLVEDETDIRHLLIEAVVADGHRVSQAASLSEARLILDEQGCDILVIDASLPDGSGVDLAVQASLEGMQVIIISGDPDEIERMCDHRVRYLSKPFRVEELLAAIDRLVAGHPRAA